MRLVLAIAMAVGGCVMDVEQPQASGAVAAITSPTPADDESVVALVDDAHECLLLRFPGATEFQWSLKTPHGRERFAVTGPFEADDGDVLTAWALDGRGIVNKPVFDVADHLAAGALVPVCEKTPPPRAQLAVLFPHKRNQAPKVRLFIEFMVERIKATLKLSESAA